MSLYRLTPAAQKHFPRILPNRTVRIILHNLIQKAVLQSQILRLPKPEYQINRGEIPVHHLFNHFGTVNFDRQGFLDLIV